MLKDRKEYRKKLNASGQLYIGGEILPINCFDVSVKGAKVSVEPGKILSTLEDFSALLAEDKQAEIFIQELMLSGQAQIIWVKELNQRITLGLEFANVQTKAEKLWLRRRSYRKKHLHAAELIIDKHRISVDVLNISLEGVCLEIPVKQLDLEIDALIKLQVNQFAINAIGKVVWIKREADMQLVGLQVITV